MCAEAVPWRCHRSLIADALVVHGMAVCEIAGESRLAPHRLTPFARVQGTTIMYPPETAVVAQKTYGSAQPHARGSDNPFDNPPKNGDR